MYIIDMSVDLYNVLGVTKMATAKEIKTAFYKLTLKHHPDKGGDEQIFELITNAYHILNNPVSRQNYDGLSKKTNIEYSNFDTLKNGSLNSNTRTDSVKNTGTKEFDKIWDELNAKHGYFEEDKDNIKIPSTVAKKNYETIMSVREKYDDELKPERLFMPDERFDNDKFQAAYKKSNKKSMDIIKKKDVPDAWLNNNFSNYCSIDNLDTLYERWEDDEIGANYGGIDLSIGEKICKTDMIDLEPDEMVSNHNIKQTDYMDNIKTKLKSRESMNNMLEQKQMKDYDKSNTAGYGIFDKLNLDTNVQYDNDTASAYQKLLMDRR